MNALLPPAATLLSPILYVNEDPTPEQLAEIAVRRRKPFAALLVLEPKVALLSHSNPWFLKLPSASKMRETLERVRERAPGSDD